MYVNSQTLARTHAYMCTQMRSRTQRMGVHTLCAQGRRQPEWAEKARAGLVSSSMSLPMKPQPITDVNPRISPPVRTIDLHTHAQTHAQMHARARACTHTHMTAHVTKFELEAEENVGERNSEEREPARPGAPNNPYWPLGV